MKRFLLNFLLLLFFSSALVGCGTSSIDKIDPDDYVNLPDYKNLSIDYSNNTYTEEELQQWIEQDIMSYVDAYELYNFRSVSINEIVSDSIIKIEYTGTIDGIEFESTNGEPVIVDMASDSDWYISGFKEGLLGKKIGETVLLDLVFPEDYYDPMLSGKDVSYLVELQDALVKEYPQIDDDLISKLNIEGVSTYDDYLEYYRKYIDSVSIEQNKMMEDDAIWNSLYSLCEVSDPPQLLIDEKYQEIIAGYNMLSNGGDESIEELASSMGYNVDDFTTMITSKAIEQAKEELVYMAIAKAEDITVVQKDENGEKTDAEKSEERRTLVMKKLKEYYK